MSGPRTIEWRGSSRDAAATRVLSYVFPGLLGGGALLVGASVVVVTVAAVLDGGAAAVGWLALAFLLAAVGLRKVAPLFSPGAPEFPGIDLDRTRLVAASIVGAAAIALAFRFTAAAIALGAVAAGSLLATAAVTTEGSVDPAAMTLTYGGRTIDLTALRRTRAAALGPVTVFRLSFVRGTVSPWANRTVVVPTAVAARVRPVFERGVAAEPPEADPAGRAERAIVLLFALGCLGAGPALWALVPAGSDARGVAAYVGLFGLLFGWLFLRHARTA